MIYQYSKVSTKIIDELDFLEKKMKQKNSFFKREIELE